MKSLAAVTLLLLCAAAFARFDNVWLDSAGGRKLRESVPELHATSGDAVCGDEDLAAPSQELQEHLQLMRADGKFFIAALMHNNDHVVPWWSHEMVKLIKAIGNDDFSNIFVSVYESGSTDRTPELLEAFAEVLTSLGVQHRVVTNGALVRGDMGRIEFLAGLRNTALEPMLGGDFSHVIFTNDVFFCARGVINMLQHASMPSISFASDRSQDIVATEGYSADLVCGADYVRDPELKFYDVWATHDITGSRMRNVAPFSGHATTNQKLKAQEPFQVTTCWGGLAVFRADAITQHGIRFRDALPFECSASECDLIARDFWAKDLNKVVMVPRAAVAYDAETFEVVRSQAPEWPSTPFAVEYQAARPDSLTCCPLESEDQELVDFKQCFHDPSWGLWADVLGAPEAKKESLVADHPLKQLDSSASVHDVLKLVGDHTANSDICEQSSDKIPHTIMQMHNEFEERNLASHVSGVAAWTVQHPCFTHHVYSEAEVAELIRDDYPEVYAMLKKVSAPQRTDLLRYTYLHKFGGVFADLESVPVRPISTLLREDDKLVVGLEAAFDTTASAHANGFLRTETFGTHIIAAEPQHPALRELLNVAMANVESEQVHAVPLGLKMGGRRLQATATTGSDPFTDVMRSRSDVRVLGVHAFGACAHNDVMVSDSMDLLAHMAASSVDDERTWVQHRCRRLAAGPVATLEVVGGSNTTTAHTIVVKATFDSAVTGVVVDSFTVSTGGNVAIGTMSVADQTTYWELTIPISTFQDGTISVSILEGATGISPSSGASGPLVITYNNPCDPTPCGNQGVCAETAESIAGTTGSPLYTCDCTGTGFSGDTCTVDVDECATGSACSNGGSCTNTAGSFTCDCAGTGYEGNTCATDIDECSTGTPCSNSGACTNTAGGFTCDCAGTGYEGATCTTDIDECATGTPCSNSGVCANTAGSFTCDCAGTGYEGATCATDIDECSTGTPCSNSGACTNTAGGFTCDCAGTGYDGTTCTNDVDECATGTPCSNSGVCANTVGAFTCDCAGTGFEGATCATDINECTTGTPCSNGGACTNTAGAYTCACTGAAAGWTGATCAVNPACDSTPCQNGGACTASTTTAGEFTCACAAGFSGTTCGSDDGCSTASCIPDAPTNLALSVSAGFAVEASWTHSFRAATYKVATTVSLGGTDTVTNAVVTNPPSVSGATITQLVAPAVVADGAQVCVVVTPVSVFPTDGVNAQACVTVTYPIPTFTAAVTRGAVNSKDSNGVGQASSSVTTTFSTALPSLPPFAVKVCWVAAFSDRGATDGCLTEAVAVGATTATVAMPQNADTDYTVTTSLVRTDVDVTTSSKTNTISGEARWSTMAAPAITFQNLAGQTVNGQVRARWWFTTATWSAAAVSQGSQAATPTGYRVTFTAPGFIKVVDVDRSTLNTQVALPLLADGASVSAAVETLHSRYSSTAVGATGSSTFTRPPTVTGLVTRDPTNDDSVFNVGDELTISFSAASVFMSTEAKNTLTQAEVTAAVTVACGACTFTGAWSNDRKSLKLTTVNAGSGFSAAVQESSAPMVTILAAARLRLQTGGQELTWSVAVARTGGNFGVPQAPFVAVGTGVKTVAQNSAAFAIMAEIGTFESWISTSTNSFSVVFRCDATTQPGALRQTSGGSDVQTVTLTGTGVQVTAAAGNVQYVPSRFGEGQTCFVFVKDGSDNLLDSGALEIVLTQKNEAPTITLTSTTATVAVETYDLGAALTGVVADPDTSDIMGTETVSVTIQVPRKFATVKVTGSAVATVQYVPAFGADATFTRTLVGSVADVNTALAGIRLFSLKSVWSGKVTITATDSISKPTNTVAATMTVTAAVCYTVTTTAPQFVASSSGVVQFQVSQAWTSQYDGQTVSCDTLFDAHLVFGTGVTEQAKCSIKVQRNSNGISTVSVSLPPTVNFPVGGATVQLKDLANKVQTCPATTPASFVFPAPSGLTTSSRFISSTLLPVATSCNTATQQISYYTVGMFSLTITAQADYIQGTGPSVMAPVTKTIRGFGTGSLPVAVQDMPSNTRVRVTLRVESAFADPSVTTTEIFKAADQAIASTITEDQPWVLSGSANMIACGNAAAAVFARSWTITPALTGAALTKFNNRKTRVNLKLSDILAPGTTYTVSLSVTATSHPLVAAATSSWTKQFPWSPIVAAIRYGDNVQVGQSSDVAPASLSSDPDGQTLVHVWSCTDLVTGLPCVDVNVAAASLAAGTVAPAITFADARQPTPFRLAPGVYSIDLLVEKTVTGAYITATASQTVTVLPTNIAVQLLVVSTNTGVIPRSDAVVVIASQLQGVESASAITYSSSVTQDQAAMTFPASTLSKPYIILNGAGAAIFNQGSTIDVSMDVDAVGAGTGSGSVSLTVNLPPVGSKIDVEPATGEPLVTEFGLSTAPWTDAEGSELQYQFFVRFSDNSEVALTNWLTTPAAVTTLPTLSVSALSETITVGVRARDDNLAIGQAITADVTLTRAAPVQVSDIESLLNSAADDATSNGDSVGLGSSIAAATSVVQNPPAGVSVDALTGSLLGALTNVYEQDGYSTDTLLDTMEAVPVSNSQNVEQLAALLDTVYQNEVGGQTLEPAQMGQRVGLLLNALLGLSGSNRRRLATVTQPATTAAASVGATLSVVNVLNSFLESASSSTLTIEGSEVTSDKNGVSVVVTRTSHTAGSSAVTAGSVTVTVPEAALAASTSAGLVDVGYVTMPATLVAAGGLTHAVKPHIAATSGMIATNSSGAAVEYVFTGLNLDSTCASAECTAQCVSWDGSTLTKETTVVNADRTQVTCTADHVNFMMVAADEPAAVPVPESNNTVVIVLMMLLAVVVIVLAIAVLLKPKKQEQSNDTETWGKAAATPAAAADDESTKRVVPLDTESPFYVPDTAEGAGGYDDEEATLPAVQQGHDPWEKEVLGAGKEDEVDEVGVIVDNTGFAVDYDNDDVDVDLDDSDKEFVADLADNDETFVHVPATALDIEDGDDPVATLVDAAARDVSGSEDEADAAADDAEADAGSAADSPRNSPTAGGDSADEASPAAEDDEDDEDY